MGLHHATLKAAVALYAILLAQGKQEAEIKAEIAKDPKEFSPEDVNEIYDELVAQAVESGADSKSETESPKGEDIPGTQELTEDEGFEKVIASNNEVIASNERVITGINNFIEAAGKLTMQIAGNPTVAGAIAKETALEDFDPKAGFIVSDGKSFRDPQDFAKIYKEGDKVRGLSEDKLRSLFTQGLIEEA